MLSVSLGPQLGTETQSTSGTLKNSELKRRSKNTANWEKSITEVKVSIILGKEDKEIPGLCLYVARATSDL